MTPNLSIRFTRRIASLTAGLAVLAATTGTATAHTGGVSGGGMMGGWGLFGGGMLLWSLLLVVLIVALVYPLTRRSATTQSDRALAELRERYARGDLSNEEFDRRRSALEN